MLENAEEAHKVLEAKLTRIEAEDAVVEGMEVDLWIEEIGTNIAATVVDLGESSCSLSTQHAQREIELTNNSVHFRMFRRPRVLEPVRG